jgi:hypothetical protein
MRKISTLILAVVLYFSAHAVTRVTCVGTSITWGAFIEDNVHYTNPVQDGNIADHQMCLLIWWKFLQGDRLTYFYKKKYLNL